MKDFTATCAFLLVSALLITSCSQWTDGDYTKNVRAWHGANIAQVVGRFGPPAQTFAHGKSTAYLYRRFSPPTNMQQPPPVIGVNGQGRQVTIMTSNPTMQASMGNATSLCEATFIADNQGKILDVQTVGNGCASTFAK